MSKSDSRSHFSRVSAREAAVDVLLAIGRGRTTLASEIDRGRKHLRDERDRGLLVELATGTLRWQAELDALLKPCSTRPLDELAPGILAILRVAAYQLKHLDRVPIHAVLNEAVESTRTIGEPRAAGFVNAVLRTLLRGGRLHALPPRPDPAGSLQKQIAYLATALSHPAWLVTRWIERHGFEAAERWCIFNNTSPEITFRSAGPLTIAELLARMRDAGVEAAPSRFVSDAATLSPGALSHVPPVLWDEIFVQDEASQLVARAVGAAPGQRVLDVCAAPGGKTLVLSSDLGDSGLLVAADFRSARVRLLQRTVRRAAANAHVVTLDATKPLPFGEAFDRVFVDAPCSGLGVLRRDPDVKWSRRPEDLPAFAEGQQRMLARAADAVAPGGRLIYATCSSEPEENDRVVDAFLAQDSRFMPSLISLGPLVTAGDSLIEPSGRLRTLPFRDGLDGFFAAALDRRP
jgi:16S rRNA (cytosine967-C5)-methyltransferase